VKMTKSKQNKDDLKAVIDGVIANINGSTEKYSEEELRERLRREKIKKLADGLKVVSSTNSIRSVGNGL